MFDNSDNIDNLFSSDLNFKFGKNENKKIDASPFYNQLIIIDSNQIKSYSLFTKNLTIVKEVNNEILSFEVGSEMIFWTEKDLPMIRSLSQNFSSDLTHTKRLKPQAVAYDYVTEKFYIIDKSAETVSVIDKVGKYHGIVLSDIEKPHDIAIDVHEGYMFITQHSKSVNLLLNSNLIIF